MSNEETDGEETFRKASENWKKFTQSTGFNEVDCTGCVFEEAQLDCKWCDKYNCHPLVFEDNTAASGE